MEKLIIETFEEIKEEGLTVDELFHALLPRLIIGETRTKFTPTKLNCIINKMMKNGDLVRFRTPIERIDGKFTHYLYVLPQYSHPHHQTEADYYRLFSSAQFTFLNLFADKSTFISTASMQKYMDLVMELVKFKSKKLPEPPSEEFLRKEATCSFINLFKQKQETKKEMKSKLKELEKKEEPERREEPENEMEE